MNSIDSLHRGRESPIFLLCSHSQDDALKSPKYSDPTLYINLSGSPYSFQLLDSIN